MTFNGFLAIDKPLGIRSSSCVSRVSKILGKGTKAGHSGTLDSTARGLLVILLGKATRLCQYVMDLPKTYEGTVEFGVKTSTDDRDGEILETSPVPEISKSLIDSLIPSFLGTRLQRPPAVSALRISGERAHKIARDGRIPDLKPRAVTMTSVEVLSCSSREVNLKVVCSKGTYIRSLARDIGDLLGCGGYLKSLTRVSIGPFELSDTVMLDPEIEDKSLKDVLTDFIKPLDYLSGSYSCYSASEETCLKLKNGLAVPLWEFELKTRGLCRPFSPVMVTGKSLISFCDIAVFDKKPHLVPITNTYMDGDDRP